MNNTGIILVLAYPDTVVMVAEEWYSPFLHLIGIGKKNYLKAGHAALVLINKAEGDLEYHDFGRYITPEPMGRVRGANHDGELNFPVKAKIVNGQIENLDEIIKFLANNPKLTHGDGKLVISVCDEIDYTKARSHINELQGKGSIRYAAFLKDACNCARFVTTTLIASLTNNAIRKKLKKTLRFTPSTVGNVVLASGKNKVFEAEGDKITVFKSTVFKQNLKYFLDRLPNHKPSFKGTLEPKEVNDLDDKAQWLEGIASGAWFEITKPNELGENEYRLRRISPYGNIDIDAIFLDNGSQLDITKDYKIIHDSNCEYCTIVQNETIFEIKYLRDFS